jgi:hypothetical protein
MSFMSDEQEKKPLHPETFFLPPLKMVLTFLDKDPNQDEKQEVVSENQEKAIEKDVEKLIEKLSEKEE